MTGAPREAAASAGAPPLNPVRVDHAAAARMATLRKPAWLRRPLPPPRDGGLPRLDLVWMPCHLFTFRLDRAGAGKGRIHGRIEHWSRAFSLVDLEEALAPGPPGEGEVLPDEPVDETDLAEEARSRIMATLLVARTRTAGATVGARIAAARYHQPYWVYYYRRRGNRIDIRLVDAATGERPGSKTKAGVLTAFVRASRGA